MIAAIAGTAAGAGPPAAASFPPPAPPGRIWVCLPVEAYHALVRLGRIELSR